MLTPPHLYVAEVTCRALLLTLLPLLALGGCATTSAPDPRAPVMTRFEAPARLIEATVSLVKRNGRAFCTGAVAYADDLVLTAAHCLKKRQRVAFLRLSNGRRVTVRVAGVARHADVAVLRAARALGPRPLPLAAPWVADGPVRLWFLGQPKPRREIQVGVIKKRGKCPRLPSVPGVIYSSHRGFPGDSGAPLLTRYGIVGVVSGGPNCQMAIPSAEVLDLLDASQMR